MNLSLLVFACTRAPEQPAEPLEIAPTSCPGDEEGQSALLVVPFVQLVTATSAWIVWETSSGEGSRVDFGPGETLTRSACGDLVSVFEGADPASAITQVHEVLLGDLSADTVYSYQVRTGETTSSIAHFRTPPERTAESDVHIIALGDSQRDDAHPDKLREVVNDGVIPWARGEWDPDLANAIDMVVLAGDLVDNGYVASDWTDDFFASTTELLGSVPLYPAPGNHEGNSPLYFRYFHLPDGAEEHWYTIDESNVRLISLDSNPPFDSAEQLAWLEGVLDDACIDPLIDFVFAELHHPHRSELWPAGESDWSSEVVSRLEQFSSDCGKPSVHLFGHTHAYSRGQSREHNHLWVNVSSAGGALDLWGSSAQIDYPEFSSSQDTWGFVAVDVSAGDSPSFRLRRVSRGNDTTPHDNAITDEITIWRDNTPPDAPRALGQPPSACEGPPVLLATPYSDVDGHAHQASQWQVAASCETFGAPMVDRWRQSQNLYAGLDTQQGDDLTDEAFPELTPGLTGCWRVRYRDAGLAWGGWSTPEPFALSSCL